MRKFFIVIVAKLLAQFGASTPAINRQRGDDKKMILPPPDFTGFAGVLGGIKGIFYLA